MGLNTNALWAFGAVFVVVGLLLTLLFVFYKHLPEKTFHSSSIELWMDKHDVSTSCILFTAEMLTIMGMALGYEAYILNHSI